jgi:hypothetical protein
MTKDFGGFWQSLTAVVGAVHSKMVKQRTSARKRLSRRVGNAFTFENLEARRVLTTFYLDPHGSFFIGGTEGPDVMVAETTATHVFVTINSATQSRPLSQVRELVFLGRNGDDRITNNTFVAARMFGGNGNDTIISGQGNDRLVGNQGNDTLIAYGGNNIMVGSAGSNTIRGGIGNDRIYGGYGGQNTIYGGAGNDVIFAGDRGDLIYADEGNDEIYGGAGDDVLYGGAGSDLIVGGGGNDRIFSDGSSNRLYGGPGDDSLYAEGSFNQLFGNAGNDGLFGGMGNGNILKPGLGRNRVLLAPGNAVPPIGVGDAAIRFVNLSADWTYKEIEAVDRGLRALHYRTGGTTTLLKDTTSSNPLTIVKYAGNDSTLAGNAGWNYQTISLSIQPNGTVNETYTREIRIKDFDENNDHQYRLVGLTLIHEISHSWDSAYEINRIVPRGWIWDQFIALSGWTTQNPGSSAYTMGAVSTQDLHEYQIIGGQIHVPTRNWWYQNGAVFARPYGTNNAKEDWAVTWETAFFDEVYGGPLSAMGYTPIPSKVAKINEFFAALA